MNLWTSLLGHYVHAGNILATQRHFRWHPGAHVSCPVALPLFFFGRTTSLLLSTVIVTEQLHLLGAYQMPSIMLIPGPTLSHFILTPFL